MPELVRPAVENADLHGAVAGILEDGKSQFFSVGGTRDGKNDPPDPSTVFEIGSITKVFTGLLLARMVAQHEVSSAGV